MSINNKNPYSKDLRFIIKTNIVNATNTKITNILKRLDQKDKKLDIISNICSCSCCCKADGKYKCSKCNVFICSVECYKTHKNSICSEEFYMKEVHNSLKDKKCLDVKKIKEMLILLH